MKRITLVLSLALSSMALGQYVNDKYLDTLQSTGTSVNGSTKTNLGGPAGLPPGAYTVQCDAAAYFEVLTTSTATTSSTTGLLIQAAQPWPFGVPNIGEGAPSSPTPRNYPAVISVSGTVNCKFYRSNG
jgi:hypothetical protein